MLIIGSIRELLCNEVLLAMKLHVAKADLTKRKVRLKQAFRLFLFKELVRVD